jgi:DNA mismatch repair protein MSH3
MSALASPTRSLPKLSTTVWRTTDNYPMAPKSSPPSSNLSQKSKQQTISSFFTPKPSQQKPTTTKTPSLVETERAHASTDAYLDDENDNVLPVPVPQATGSKRVASEDDDMSPALKRVRIAGGVEEDDRPSLGHASAAVLNAAKPKQLHDRTSKYIFSSSSPIRDENEDEEDAAESQMRKERLHDKFVKKLGKPDSFAELRRKNKILSEENADGGEGGEDEEEEEAIPQPAKGKKGAAAKKSGSKLTPMEKQYLEIKRKHLDTIIVMEVGYKFKIWGEDARIASKELGIFCIPGKFRYDERMRASSHFMFLADKSRSI